jgi:hypothetical protein
MGVLGEAGKYATIAKYDSNACQSDRLGVLSHKQ